MRSLLHIARQILHTAVYLFLVLLIAAIATFAVVNRAPVDMSLWPFADVRVPLYVAVLGAAAVGLVAGGALCWLGRSRLWLRARASERRAERLARAAAEQSNAAAAAQAQLAIPAPPLPRPAPGLRARAAVDDG